MVIVIVILWGEHWVVSCPVVITSQWEAWWGGPWSPVAGGRGAGQVQGSGGQRASASLLCPEAAEWCLTRLWVLPAHPLASLSEDTVRDPALLSRMLFLRRPGLLAGRAPSSPVPTHLVACPLALPSGSGSPEGRGGSAGIQGISDGRRPALLTGRGAREGLRVRAAPRAACQACRSPGRAEPTALSPASWGGGEQPAAPSSQLSLCTCPLAVGPGGTGPLLAEGGARLSPPPVATCSPGVTYASSRCVLTRSCVAGTERGPGNRVSSAGAGPVLTAGPGRARDWHGSR